jgi:uncharacterized protein YkwD
MQRPIGVAGLSFLLAIFVILAGPIVYAHASRTAEIAAVPGTATEQPPPEGSASGYIYTVQRNDTLWDIAVAHGISTSALIAANNLANPQLLRPGQTLFVPAEPPATSKGYAVDAAPAQPPSLPAGATSESDQAQPAPPAEASVLLALINQKRVAAGLPELAWSPEAAQAAQAHAEDCARRNGGSHTGSDGATLETRLARAGITPHRASENWANAQSVQRAFALWWSEAPGSGPHRRNILDRKFTRIGIGVARGAWGLYFIADFAEP